MSIDVYNDLMRVSNKLGLVLNNPNPIIRINGDFETGDLVVMARFGRVPLPVNILTLKYEKGALRSVTRNLTITKKRDKMTGLYVTETYTREWRFK